MSNEKPDKVISKQEDKKPKYEIHKKDVYEGVVESLNFPNKGVINIFDRRVVVKNVLPGQKVAFRICKVRDKKCPGSLVKVLEKSDIEDMQDVCKHANECGGCSYPTVSYQHQLEIKKDQVLRIFHRDLPEFTFDGLKGSPLSSAYRNRMDYTFGDSYKDGPLSLGLHKQEHFNDVISIPDCRIADKDFSILSTFTLQYFTEKKIPYYHKIKKEGYLRNLVVRKSKKANEILYILITTSKLTLDLTELKDKLLQLQLSGKIVGIIHTIFDNPTDMCGSDKNIILYGQDYLDEDLLGLHFKVMPLSFFQTNSYGAEVLYSTVRDYVFSTKAETVFDLYCGTGTITQILSPVCKKIIGVEIDAEGINSAKKSVEVNGLKNCEFIAGDVLNVLDNLTTNKPDLIVLDPPRSGCHPKALEKIIEFGAKRVVYVSCMPLTLVRDLHQMILKGYKLERITCVDMFPNTFHVETVALLTKN